MASFLFVLAIVHLAVVSFATVYLIQGLSKVVALCDAEVTDDSTRPTVALIAPARNEEWQIEAAVESMLRLDYQPLQITVIDDRSTDRTGQILDALAQRHEQLNVVHITELPPNWLGKNHALEVGAQRSTAEWLLFTDGDVIFEPWVLTKATAYARQNKIDHLVLMPDTRMPTWLLRCYVTAFATLGLLVARPWKAIDKKSSAHLGVGAFNLIRADVYRDIGGHQAIALRPDDDLKLGKLVKKFGYSQQVMSGVGAVRVEWYRSLREMMVGLEKNSFAALEYNLPLTIVFPVAVLFVALWPIAGMFLTTGWTPWINVAIYLLLVAMSAKVAQIMNYPITCALMLPFGIAMIVFIGWRGTLLTLWRGGVQWRDTIYPLTLLKTNKI